MRRLPRPAAPVAGMGISANHSYVCLIPLPKARNGKYSRMGRRRASFRRLPATAFSILLWTENVMLSGFFLRKKPPRTMLAMSGSESKALYSSTRRRIVTTPLVNPLALSTSGAVDISRRSSRPSRSITLAMPFNRCCSAAL